MDSIKYSRNQLTQDINFATKNLQKGKLNWIELNWIDGNKLL